MIPAIEVRGLRKSFGDHEVLKGVDLVVEAGEVVCVIGPSGSGKSTLLRCVNRLEEPSAGTIVIEGEDITDEDCEFDDIRRGYEHEQGLTARMMDHPDSKIALEASRTGDTPVYPDLPSNSTP